MGEPRVIIAPESGAWSQREAAAYLVTEAQRLAVIADRFGLQDAGDSCHQLRLRAETALRQDSYQGSARR